MATAFTPFVTKGLSGASVARRAQAPAQARLPATRSASSTGNPLITTMRLPAMSTAGRTSSDVVVRAYNDPLGQARIKVVGVGGGGGNAVNRMIQSGVSVSLILFHFMIYVQMVHLYIDPVCLLPCPTLEPGSGGHHWLVAGRKI